jgi:hypothetical protein
MRTSIFFAFLFSPLLLFASCSHDQEAENDFYIDQDLIGTWRSDGHYIGTDVVYVFNSNGAYSYKSDSYSIKGNFLTSDTAIWDDGTIMEDTKSLFLDDPEPSLENPSYWYKISSDGSTLLIMETAGGLEQFNRS